MVTALTSSRRTRAGGEQQVNEHMRPRGRHRLPRSSGRARRAMLAKVSAGVVAAAAAGALVLTMTAEPARPAAHTNATGEAAISQQLSASDIQVLNSFTPAQRAKAARAITTSLAKAGIQAGTGTTPESGIDVAAKSWSWGFNSSDVWFIATWHDVRDGAILAAGGYCTLGMTIAGLGPVGTWAGLALCGTIVGLALHMADGKANTTSAGLWITLYWHPLHLASGTWAN